MEYASGGGTWYEGGTWEARETQKRITLTLIDDPFWEPNFKKLVLEKDKSKTRGNPYEQDDDGTLTVYPNQCGIPHIFTKEA